MSALVQREVSSAFIWKRSSRCEKFGEDDISNGQIAQEVIGCSV